MPNCVPIPFGDSDEFACSVCGDELGRDDGGHLTGGRFVKPCRLIEKPPTFPPLFKRLRNFTLAAIKHCAAGNPTCTQEQIDSRLEICRDCPLYVPDKGNPALGTCSHESCGCSLGREQKFLNKLAWADQQCPIEKWAAIPAGSPASP